jgi:hypothetical protein
MCKSILLIHRASEDAMGGKPRNCSKTLSQIIIHTKLDFPNARDNDLRLYWDYKLINTSNSNLSNMLKGQSRQYNQRNKQVKICSIVSKESFSIAI